MCGLPVCDDLCQVGLNHNIECKILRAFRGSSFTKEEGGTLALEAVLLIRLLQVHSVNIITAISLAVGIHYSLGSCEVCMCKLSPIALLILVYSFIFLKQQLKVGFVYLLYFLGREAGVVKRAACHRPKK